MKFLSHLNQIILKQFVFDIVQFVWIHAVIEYHLAGDHELPEFVAQRHRESLYLALFPKHMLREC